MKQKPGRPKLEKDKRKVTVAFRLPPEVNDRLAKIANITGQTKTDLLILAINRAFGKED